jgi:hypothetical protein
MLSLASGCASRPNETQYFYTDYDGTGAQLDGSKTYSIAFAFSETTISTVQRVDVAS